MNNSETVYREILQKSLNRITDEIILLETQNNKLLNIVTSSSKRIERLLVEKEQIQKELKSRDSLNQTKVDGVAKEFIDDRIKAIAEKQGNHAQRINELEGLKRKVNSNFARAVINRRIMHERKKIERLRSATNIISDVQKAMMMPKYMVERYKLGKYAKRQGNVNYFENRLAEVENKQSLLNTGESIVNKVQSVYYDIKGKYYAKRLDKANKKLEKLQQKGVQNRILGANATAISKNAVDKLRQRMQKQMKEEQQERKAVQQQPKMEERQLPAVIYQTPIPENITASSLAEEAARNANMSRTTTQTKVA